MEPKSETPADDLQPGDTVVHKSEAFVEHPVLWVVKDTLPLLTCRAWNPAAFAFAEQKFARAEVVKHDNLPTAAEVFAHSVAAIVGSLRQQERHDEAESLRGSAVGFFAAVGTALEDKGVI